MRETTLQTPRSVKNEGEEVLETSEQSLPLQLVLKTMARQVVPLQPMEVHSEADLHLQPVEGIPHWSRGMPEGRCDPVGSPRWSRLLPGPADPWREKPTPEQVCWQGL